LIAFTETMPVTFEKAPSIAVFTISALKISSATLLASTVKTLNFPYL